MASEKLKNLITVIGVVGAIASIIALIVIFVPRSKNLELSVTTSLAENLTDKKLIDPDLKALYLYKGDTIDNLWRLIIELKNESHETFVISDKVQNILVDTLKLKFAEGVKLIDKKIIEQDFPNNSYILRNGNEFGLTFQQWRSQESLKLSFYIQTIDTIDIKKKIFSSEENRPILNGDINFYYESTGKNNKQKINSFVPPQIRGIAYVLVITAFIIIIIVLLIALISTVIGFYKRKEWKREELPNYNIFIEKKYSDNQRLKNEYLNNPKKFFFWTDYKGPHYPQLAIEFNIDKGVPLLFSILFTLIGIFIMSTVILDLILVFP